MLLIVGIATAAAAAVLIYNAYKDSRPDLETSSARRARQLAAVVLVMSRAVEGVVEALTLGLRPEAVVDPAASRTLEPWDREDW